jgi:hypothetical protein
MAFNWNFKRQPDLTNYIGAQIDPYNASRIASENMQGYRPNAAFTPGTPAEQAAAAMQGYTQNPQGGQFSVPNDMHGGMGQPDLEGYGESLQAASDAAAQAQAKEQQIADIESQISALEKRIADNTAKLQNFTGNADQIAAIEARKINSADPTAIWRWKVDRDEAKRIANAQNKPNDTARANALIDANNTLDSMIINDSLDTPTKNAMLSKLADVKSSLEKNGFDTSRVNSMISKLKGNGEQTTREQAKTDWKGLKGKPDLTSNEIQTALDNPDMNWDPDERKEAENLRDKLKKHEAATQDVKDMKAWVEKTYGKKWHILSPRLQETYQRLWKNNKGKK